ncbi:hypothetical protein [Vulcanisaeta sp. JCM 16159]
MNPINDYLKDTIKDLQGEKAFTYLAKAREVTEKKVLRLFHSV